MPFGLRTYVEALPVPVTLEVAGHFIREIVCPFCWRLFAYCFYFSDFSWVYEYDFSYGCDKIPKLDCGICRLRYEAVPDAHFLLFLPFRSQIKFVWCLPCEKNALIGSSTCDINTNRNSHSANRHALLAFCTRKFAQCTMHGVEIKWKYEKRPLDNQYAEDFHQTDHVVPTYH